ncbi:MAG: FtsK/SpoIIIE domain-containing protein [Actinomycetota bacterium]
MLLRKKVKDLRSLERTGDPETPPALVVVVDEFAEIAAEIPAFTDGLLDILRQGRAVGVHLVLATQRSLGGASTQLQTQTNLRIALRVADADDSTAAVGDASAATFDPGLPGRAVARTNAGRPILFQTAYSGGLSFADTSASPVSITELRFGAELLWEHSVQERTIPERLITDQGRIVATIKAASREASIGAPRKPLPPELSASYDLAVVPQRRVDTELVLGVSDDIVNGKQDPVLFLPDQHGNIGIFGAGGSGKTTALRTLVAAAGITPKGGPVDVYAIDFAGGGLRMLEALPNVGAVVSGDDQERIIRLLRMLRDEAESRSVRFSTMLADTITSYRRIAGEPDERRLLLLIDGFPSFRESFETSSALSKWFSVFHDLMSLGRPLGIHVALTADRPLALGRQTAAALSRRVLLRMTDEIDYDGAREGRIVMGMNTPPGRGIVDKLETQIAVLGGDGNVSAQAKAIRELGEAMERAGRVTAPSIGVLSHEISPQEMPANVQGAPVLGVSDDDLQPIGFRTTGVFLVGGPSGSGRSTALRWLAESVRRAHPDAKAYYLGNQSSELPATGNWAAIARTPETVIELARELASSIAVAPEQPKTLIIVEDIASFLNTPPDGALVELMKSVKRSRHLLVAESEISGWGSSWPLLSEAKGFRHGFLLQPDASDTDLILRTTAPRVTRSEFPPGRGLYVSRGKVVRVQLPHA